MAVVYRHFAASGELLYVGSSVNAFQRTFHHSKDSAWFKEIASITLEHFDDIESARQAEILAIKIESPRENMNHKPHDLFRKKTIKPPSISYEPHIQIDALMREYDVGYPALGAYLGMTNQAINEMKLSGRQFTDEEITVIRRKLGTTYKRLAKIGITFNNKVKGK